VQVPARLKTLAVLQQSLSQRQLTITEICIDGFRENHFAIFHANRSLSSPRTARASSDGMFSCRAVAVSWAGRLWLRSHLKLHCR
jgi:hypothetical protein